MPTTTADFHVGDVGSAIVLHVEEKDLINDPSGETKIDFDVSGATVMQIKVLKPDGQGGTTVQIFTAAFADVARGGNGTGTDGMIMAITTAADDFEFPGDYEARAYLEVPGWSGHSDPAEFPVGAIWS